MRGPAVTAAMLVSLAFVLGGCGGDGDKKATGQPSVTTLPDCAPGATRAALPAAFPEAFPLPSRTER